VNARRAPGDGRTDRRPRAGGGPAVDWPDLHRRLDVGLAALGIDIDPGVPARLIAYLELLERWNRVHNLTAVRDPGEMVTRHLLDSLAALSYIEGPAVIDVGSGAGLPGIPVALARPELSLTLVEARGRRARFLEHVVDRLALTNVRVADVRVQDLGPGAAFDTLTARAFASLDELLRVAGHLCRPGAAVVAYKGRRPQEEVAAIAGHAFAVERIVPLTIPGLDAPRHLVVLRAPGGSEMDTPG